MASEEALCPEIVEGIPNDRACRFLREAQARVGSTDMNPELPNHRIGCIWPQSATTDVLTAASEKDRPVLDAMNLLRFEFALESLPDLVGIERAPDPAGHRRVSPKAQGQLEVGSSPVAEPESRGFEEIHDHQNCNIRRCAICHNAGPN